MLVYIKKSERKLPPEMDSFGLSDLRTSGLKIKKALPEESGTAFSL
jgi:hypothetical protein